MKKIIRLTEKGFQEFSVNEKEIMVFLSGKPLSGSLITLQGGEKKVMNFYRGNSAGAYPFLFKNLDLALDAFKRVRWERENAKENAKVFSGNMYIGDIVDDAFQARERPIMQLL